MKNRNRSLKKGVSDVIATLLILAITVTLFSTIFVWVQTFPPPEGKRVVEIEGERGISEVAAGQYKYYINLTHKGGEPLSKNLINIVITLTDVVPTAVFVKTVSDSTVNLGDFWESGEVWRWNTTGTYTVISNITVVVIDTAKNMMIWQGRLPGIDLDAPPQILERGTEPEVVETGKAFRVWVIVKDTDLNFNSVYIDLQKLDNTTFRYPIKMNHTSGWKFITENLSLSPTVMPGRYTGIINATDNKSHTTVAQITINVVTGEGLPQLIVDRILLSNQSPTRGDNVTITAVIKNLKARAAQNATITFNDSLSNWNYTTNISVSGYGQTLVFTYWEAKPGGVHRISVNITNVMPGNLTGIGANVTVVVTPRILLVDDDGALTGSPNDVVSYMASALISTNLRYDIAVVSGGADGPGYNTGEKKLKDYDVVIWMGGSTNSTLTANDQNNLNTFLDNGGRLWLIGQNIFETVPSWFTNKVGAGISNTIAMPARLIGTNPGANWIDTSGLNPPLQSVSPFTIARQLNPVSGARPVFYDTSSTRVLATQYNASTYKTVVFGFEFARINSTGDQAVIVYKVINWLAGIDLRTGVDVAVAGQTIEPLTPRYNQPVNITAIIRNNGNVNLTGVRTRLYINDQPKTLLDNVTDLAGNGSWKSIKFQWVPDRVGSYIVKVMVDPDNEIDETNEANNVYVSDVAVFKIEVIYTALLVDDDSSSENGGGGTNPDVAAHVLKALNLLGYTVGVNLDVQKVPRGQDRDNNAYNASNYSCIIWVTGACSAGGGYNTLTNNDMNVIQNYLSAGLDQVSFLLIGRNILADSVVQNRPDFYQNIMGASTTGSVVAKTEVYGVRENPVTNGMYIGFDNASIAPYNVRSYTKIASAIPLFWADGTSYWTRTSDNVVGTGIASNSGWHSAYLSFDLAYTTNTSAVAEFLYGVIHWFGRLDNKPELRVTPPDMFAGTNTRQYIILPELNPQLGESYVLKANITNWGGKDADVIVRFLDGDTVIGSQNVHVPASYRDVSGQTQNGKVTAEVIWTPLFAGIEPIRANVDPDGLLVGVEFLRPNNLAEQRIEVYYFYDDLEDPAKVSMNWKHEATLLRINGEAPLEYMDPVGNVDVNIIRNWEEMKGFNKTNKSAHTYPSSFYMTEATGGGRLPMSVHIVIDASGSMRDDWPGNPGKWTATRNALFAFLDKMNTTLGDEACLTMFSHSGVTAGEVNLRSYTYTNPYWAANYGDAYQYTWVHVINRFTTNMQTIKNAFDARGPYGNTPLTDAIGFGARWLVDNEYVGGQRVGYNRSHYPALIVLTDGASNYNNPYGTANTNAINDIRGNAWGGVPALRFDGGKTLNSTVPVFIIGLGGDAVDSYLQPVADASFQILKRGPFSSGGHTWRDQYFYAPTGNELQAIFDAIFKALEDWGGDVTAPPMVPTAANPAQPMAITLTRPINTNGCNYTLTPAITLSADMATAKLTFYHRYNMVVGKNGGVVLVGTSDGSFNNFKYLVPTKNYPNNLATGLYVDAYGNPITYAYSGSSAGSTAGWEYAEFDLTQFIPASGTRQIKIAFQFLAKSENTGNGGFWYIDDVEVKITRKNTGSASNVADQWQYIQDANRAHRGSGVWWNGNPSTGYFSGGIDNSLITRPIDLTNARNATLSAYFRFNVNWGTGGTGRPPDGFRVEVSADNGVTWQPICLGVRSGWNVSGWENAPDLDPIRPGIQTYTGVTETGDKAYWVPASSLYRLNVDLSGWRGSVVLLRFRVVTNSTLANHYAQPISSVGFGGLYIDDIKVFGETIIHGTPQAKVTVPAPTNDYARMSDAGQPCTADKSQNAEISKEINSISELPATSPSGSFYSIFFIASTILAAPCTRTSQQGRPKSFS